MSVCTSLFFPTRPSDRDQIWHTSYSDRHGNGLNLKKSPAAPGVPRVNLRGSKFKKSVKFNKLPRKLIIIRGIREGGKSEVGREGPLPTTVSY